MSGAAEQRWRGRGEMTAGAQALEAIAENLEAAGRKAAMCRNGLELRNGPVHTRVTLEAVNRACEDGARVTGVLKVASEIAGFPENLDEQLMAGLNRYATLGALVRDGDSGKPLVVSRISLYENDVNTMRFYVPLAATAALCQAECLLLAAGGPAAEGIKKPVDEGPRGIGSMWGEEDFELAARFFKGKNLFTNADAGGLAVEFPFEEGAFSAIFGHKTSLLTLTNQHAHPVAGKGLLFVLKLIGVYEAGQAASMAHRFNRKEYEGLDMVPMSGAWVATPVRDGRAGLAFMGFWPNMMYLRGSVLNLGVWMLYRNEWMKRELGGTA